MIPIRPLARAAVAAVALVASLSAQKDRVVFIDGKVVDQCTVTNYDLRKLEYKARGETQQVDSDLVSEVSVEKVKETYRRAYAEGTGGAGPETFIQIAGTVKEPFLAQFGYSEAARILLENGSVSEAFATYEELATKYPDSAFVPVMYRAKLDYYCAQGKDKAGEAASVAKRYDEAANTQGYPHGFQLEARYYMLLSQAIAGGSDGPKLLRDFEALANEAGSYTNVANRCRMLMGEIYEQGDKAADAEKTFKDLLDKPYLDPVVRASSLRGVANAAFSRGSASDKGPYLDALLGYLRVYVEVPKASPEVTAECLFKASQSADKWGGDDSARMSARLRAVLRRDYPTSEWAKR